MTTYFSTFPYGTEKIIERIVKEKLPDYKIQETFKDFIIYSSEKALDQQSFFSNTFKLITKFGSPEMQSIAKLAEWASSSTKFIEELRNFSKTTVKFKVQFSENSTSVSIKEALDKVLLNIHNNTNWTYSPDSPDYEIWFIKKKDFSLCGIKFLKQKEKLEKGELRPEIAYVMNFLADPKPSDIFLEPFVGNGAIAISRLKNFPAKKLIVTDTNINPFIMKLENQTINKNKFDINSKDGFKLKWLQKNSIDKIVTDPPWGRYKEDQTLKEKYSEMLQNFSRVVKKDGFVVLLVADLLKIASTYFIEKESHEVYIGGNRSYIVKLTKQ